MTGPVSRFLKPASAAVIGASRRQDGPSDFLVRAILAYGQPSELHLVNPGGHEIGGRASVRSVEELPDGIDLSLVMVPAPSVVATVEACAAKGFGGAIIYSAGSASFRRRQRLQMIVQPDEVERGTDPGDAGNQVQPAHQ